MLPIRYPDRSMVTYRKPYSFSFATTSVQDLLVHQLVELLRQYLDAGQIVVDADAHLAEAVIQKQLLSLLYHAQLILSNGLTVYEPGRQTGEGRLVPGGQVKALGKLANLSFGKLALRRGLLISSSAMAWRPGR